MWDLDLVEGLLRRHGHGFQAPGLVENGSIGLVHLGRPGMGRSSSNDLGCPSYDNRYGYSEHGL
jgi:hypothetical protein